MVTIIFQGIDIHLAATPLAPAAPFVASGSVYLQAQGVVTVTSATAQLLMSKTDDSNEQAHGNPSSSGESNRQGDYFPAPKESPMPGLQQAKPKTPKPGGGLRKRWKDNDGNIYEWDYQHGKVEKYNRQGKHLGEWDPKTNKQSKPADTTRRVEP